MSEENKPLEEENAPQRDIVYEEAIESILFAAGHPITYTNLARVLNLTPGKVKQIVVDFARAYNTTELPRGVILLAYEDSCQLCTKQYYLHEIREALGIKKNGTLSTSSMEALAIVAYNQPVTRMYVDTLRRADSSYAMNNLIDRGLIECKGRMDVPGRPMLYGTTNDFLRCFGLGSLADLPGTSEELMALFAQGKQVPDRPEEESEAEQLQMELDAEPVVVAQRTEEDGDAPTHEEEHSAEDDIVFEPDGDEDLPSETDADDASDENEEAAESDEDEEDEDDIEEDDEVEEIEDDEDDEDLEDGKEDEEDT